MFNINTAIIGAGFMGPAHAEALRRIGVNVIGILGVDEAESAQAAADLHIPMAYPDLNTLLSDPNVHAIHITTPNKLHFQMARDGLNAGKHVLCEKPLAMTSKETAELVKLAQQKKRAAGVNYNMRFYPLVREARQIIEDEEIGDVFSIVGSYVQDWLLYPTDYNWRVLAEEGGDVRAVGDIGTHWLDMVQFISGLKVTAVCADLKTVHPIRKRPKGEVETYSAKVQDIEATDDVTISTEDSGAILLRFENGVNGCLWVSQTTAGRKNCLRFEIAGSEKAMSWNSESPNEMWIGSRNAANQSLLKDPGLLSDVVRPFASYPGGHNEGYPDSLKQSFTAFYSYIAAGDFSAIPQFATFEDGQHEVLLCEAIFKSHQKGKWVEVGG
ncbi:Gfo/Idh/MocA family oxidoreductase [candidate division KSB1 bacterium]|nr:Gfo/Idh/MocA family oxidoreductase [candidate division KSB1 bacterium]